MRRTHGTKRHLDDVDMTLVTEDFPTNTQLAISNGSAILSAMKLKSHQPRTPAMMVESGVTKPVFHRLAASRA